MSLAHVDAFAALFTRPMLVVDRLGPFVDRAWSPGDLMCNPADEEEGWPPLADLCTAGWPIPPDITEPDPEQVFWELPVLPWLGHLARDEASDFLTIDGMDSAIELLIEPEANTALYGMSWRAGVRLQPGRWLAMSIALRDRHGHQPMPYATAYLAVWEIAGTDTLGALVLPHGEAYRQGYRRILGITQADLDDALDDDIRGSLAY